MSVALDTLVRYCDDLLAASTFADHCPNGLQVEGKHTIHTIITGVSASLALLEKAAQLKADLVLVHHGFFWRGEDPIIVGIKRKRLHTLLQHEMNLLAYHIPLDAHAELGNNVQLANVLGIEITGYFPTEFTPSIGLIGKLAEPLSGEAFAAHLAKTLQRRPLHIPAHTRFIKTLAWCTGSAQDYLANAATCSIDAYVSGEISERTTHIARELGVDYFSAGHHATERYGVKALGEALATRFDLNCHFVDVDNPV